MTMLNIMYAQRFRSKVCRFHADDEPELGHFSTLRSRMRDSEMLQAALKALEIPVQTDADARGSNGELRQAEIVAVLEGKFDIGFVRAEDGTFNRYGSIPRPLGRMRYSSLVGRC